MIRFLLSRQRLTHDPCSAPGIEYSSSTLKPSLALIRWSGVALFSPTTAPVSDGALRPLLTAGLPATFLPGSSAGGRAAFRSPSFLAAPSSVADETSFDSPFLAAPS